MPPFSTMEEALPPTSSQENDSLQFEASSSYSPATTSATSCTSSPPHTAKDAEETSSQDDDPTADLSDTSYLNGSSHRRDSAGSSSRSSSILRVHTLEDSLAQLDLHDDEPPQEDPNNPNSNENSNSNSRKQPRVSFTDVQVREYPVCLGDNPGGYIGVPLTLEWDHQSEASLNLEDYETSRPERRQSDQLRIPSFVREEMLRHCGYSRVDIQRGVKEANIARQRRRRTNETAQLHKAQEWASALVRSLRNRTTRRRESQEERALLQFFREQQRIQQEEAAAARKRGQGTNHNKPRRNTWHSKTSRTVEDEEASNANANPAARRGTWAQGGGVAARSEDSAEAQDEPKPSADLEEEESA